MPGPMSFASAVGLLIVAGSGCANLAPPNWSSPGTTRSQQLEAQQSDPYPEVDFGPPSEDLRPREFDQPLAEAVRAQSNAQGSPRGVPGYTLPP